MSDPDNSNSDAEELVPDDDDWNLHHKPMPSTLGTAIEPNGSDDDKDSEEEENHKLQEGKHSAEPTTSSDSSEDDLETDSNGDEDTNSSEEEDDQLVPKEKRVRGKVSNYVTVTFLFLDKKSQSLLYKTVTLHQGTRKSLSHYVSIKIR